MRLVLSVSRFCSCTQWAHLSKINFVRSYVKYWIETKVVSLCLMTFNYVKFKYASLHTWHWVIRVTANSHTGRIITVESWQSTKIDTAYSSAQLTGCMHACWRIRHKTTCARHWHPCVIMWRCWFREFLQVIIALVAITDVVQVKFRQNSLVSFVLIISILEACCIYRWRRNMAAK